MLPVAASATQKNRAKRLDLIGSRSQTLDNLSLCEVLLVFFQDNSNLLTWHGAFDKYHFAILPCEPVASKGNVIDGNVELYWIFCGLRGPLFLSHSRSEPIRW